MHRIKMFEGYSETVPEMFGADETNLKHSQCKFTDCTRHI
jgi:hypothetical protein